MQNAKDILKIPAQYNGSLLHNFDFYESFDKAQKITVPLAGIFLTSQKIWTELHQDVNYILSNYGDLYSYKSNKLLKAGLQKNGYLNYGALGMVHRLVALHFIPNPTNLPIVGHDDDIKTNNFYKNLYWTTQSENCKHNNLQSRINRPKKKVYQYTKNLKLVKVWESGWSAREGGFNNYHISSCCNGKIKTYKGFIWSFVKLKINN